MAHCCTVLTGLLVWSLLMLSWCEASRNNINRYDHSYGTFKSNSLIKRRDDGTRLKSFARVSSLPPTTVSVSDYGAKGDGKTDDTQVCMHIHVLPRIISINYLIITSKNTYMASKYKLMRRSCMQPYVVCANDPCMHA